jgi:hypothetical protein
MTKTGKITSYKPDGTAEIKGMTFNKFIVTFADGNDYKFLAKGEFKKQVGEEVQYQVTNQEYKNAKFVYEEKPNFSAQSSNRAVSTNDSILLQVCYKENMQAYGKDHRDFVMQYTEQDFLSLKNILNNLN